MKKILSFIILTLSTLSSKSDQDVVALHEGSIFHEYGHLYSRLASAHLVIKIDIENLRERRDMLVHVRDRMIDMTTSVHPNTGKTFFNKKTQEAITWMKNYLDTTILNGISRIDTTLQSFTYEDTNIDSGLKRNQRGTSISPRQRRQIFAGAMALGLGFVVASVVSEFRTQTLIKAIQQKQDVLAARVADNMVRINQIENDVEAMNKTLSKIKQVTEILINKMENVEATEMAIITCLSMSDTLNQILHITKALETARDGKFSLDLAEAKGLQAAVEEIQKQGVEEGRKLGIGNIMDLTHCDTSYVMNYTDQSIYVITHIPMYIESSYQTLYQYVTTPTKIAMENQRTMFVEVNIEDQFLALSRDNRKYNQYSQSELKQCLNFGNTYFCDSQINYYRKRKSCITSLYDNDHEGINHLCPLTLKDQVSLAIRLNETSFLITETEPQQLTITCGSGQTEKYHLEGTFIVNIHKGCVGSTENLVIERPSFETEVELTTLILNQPINLLHDLKMNEARELMEAANNFISHVGEKVPMSTVKGLAKFQADMIAASKVPFWSKLTSLMPGSLMSSVVVLAGIALIIGGVIIACKCYKKRRNHTHEPTVRYNRQQQGGNISLNVYEQPRRHEPEDEFDDNPLGLRYGIPPDTPTTQQTAETRFTMESEEMDDDFNSPKSRSELNSEPSEKGGKSKKSKNTKVDAFIHGLNR